MDAFRSQEISQKTSKSEDQQKHGLFNSLEREELLGTRHDTEVIDFSGIDESIDSYHSLKELVHDANAVAIYADQETEEAYFEHVFRRALGIDLYSGAEDWADEAHDYDDLVDHISAVNSELTGEALEESRTAYKFNFGGEEVYETE